MKATKQILKGYENTQLYNYTELPPDFSNSVWYDELPQTEVTGVLKVNRYVDGRLLQTYSEKESHVGIVAATRMGKTSAYVIPTVISFAKSKNKRSMIISDPKGEIYRHTAATLKNEGYRVLLLNFRDYTHSECWNPLTPIYRKFQAAYAVYDEVEVVDTQNGKRNSFRGRIYEDQAVLKDDVDRIVNMMMEEVGNDIDNIATMFAPTISTKDPYWEDSARELLKAYLWAMLEDSRPENLENDDSGKTLVTEETYSFATIITLMSLFRGSDSNYDDGYFSDRDKTSRAYMLAKNSILENGNVTRQCISSVFNSKVAIFREVAMRLITSCNSFEMSVLTDGQPTAIFIDFRDELKVHFKVISLFIQDAYRCLIEHANAQPDGKREIPFYFILDEFGNLPKMTDFETTISACAGRNIFFILIIQSYAQLNNVYQKDVAEIIRDNLNMHVFFGSNNPQTIREFSTECGETARVSPVSALNGHGMEIDHYQMETIPLVPKSMLSHLAPGECIVTEANCGYVLYSRLERYYLCSEFNDLPLDSAQTYACAIDPLDRKYVYKLKPKKSGRKSLFDF